MTPTKYRCECGKSFCHTEIPVVKFDKRVTCSIPAHPKQVVGQCYDVTHEDWKQCHCNHIFNMKHYCY